jgi:nitroimidazol reductase NimA-like FMN-containing flavoprotein (pyridoxamine 5'-phosphate oxidase superfamily)
MGGHIPWRMLDTQLQAIRTVWISTTRPDGRPHCVPVWFLWENGAKPGIVFLTAEETQKRRNMESQTWVVVHAGDGDDTYILEGVVERVTDTAELERLNRAYMEKYVDPGSGMHASIGAADFVYRVRVKHVMVWLYGTIAHRTDWYFD